MRRFAACLLVVATALLAASCSSPQSSASNASSGPLILISIDGFRWDYLDRYEAPTLKELARAGVRARRLTASFPTKTFPNHYTLVTGLRPGHHGIVGNSFHDPTLDDDFSMSRQETVWWDNGEPIWVTAEKQGVRTACFFWPGSEAVIHGVRPTRYQTWNKALTSHDRVDGLLAWFDVPAAQRPRFATLYFDLVDDAGHHFGPDAPETAAAVKEADDAVAHLLAGLQRLDLRDSANIVLVSDHGMASISTDRVVFLEDLMPTAAVSIEVVGTYGGVRPKPGVDEAALLAHIRARAPAQLKAYRREELPARFGYNRGERIPPIILLLDTGWCVESKATWAVTRAKYKRGGHGWDPAVPEMGALFVAAGPAFREHTVINDADNIDVYALLCRILHLRPAPNDGSDRLAQAALR